MYNCLALIFCFSRESQFMAYSVLFFSRKCISKTLFIVNCKNYFSDDLKIWQIPDAVEKTVVAAIASCEKMSDGGSDVYYLMLCPFIYYSEHLHVLWF